MKIHKLIISIALITMAFAGCKKDKFEEKIGKCPLVVATDPTDKSINVPLDQIITITFNQMINPKTITAESITINGSAPVTGTITFDAAKFMVIFVPSVKLSSNTTYVGKVKTTVKDLMGNALQADYVWSFSTGQALAPVVIDTDPLNTAINVTLNKTITAKFSMRMDNASINTSTFILKKRNTVIAGVVSYTDTTASFNPNVNLLADSTYTATITTGVKNTAGTPMTADYTWSFKTGSTVVPIVISTDPINNATGVVLNKTITATFDMPMDSMSIITGSTFTLKQGATVINGLVSYTNSVATFNPTIDLQSNLVYTATIATSAKNVAGVSIAANYVWTFTSLNTTPPTVISTDPANTAINVLVSKTITATFSTTMDAATISTSTFMIKDGTTAISGVVTYAGTTATFNPSANLTPSTTYTGTITNAVKNLQGIFLTTDYVWTFTTAAVVAPTVISTDPIDNATGVALNKTITATFSTAMNAGTITSATFTVKNGATAVAGTVSYTGTTATFNPSANLLSGTTYTGTITTGATDLAGTPLAANYVWQFTTATVVAPTVISTDPIDNATGVALNKTITATFSTPMNAGTITSATFTVKDGATAVAGTVSYTGSTATFNPSANLLSGTTYTGTITTGATDLAGTPLAANYVWQFTTATVVAPTVISTDPIDNATGVVLNKTITATFSTAMNAATITSATFTVKNGATAVAGTVSYTGTTATFNPSANLLSSTTYTGTITTGATDLAGTPLAANYVWQFNTVPPTGGPFVDLGTADSYGILAGVGISNNAGFSEIHDMNVGISPGVRSSVTGFPPAIVVNGVIHCSDDATPAGIAATLVQVKQDLTDAYLFAEGANSPAPSTVSGDQGGLTLAPGIYKTTSTLLIQNGDLTLDAQGDANAVWIFQIASDFTTVGGAGGNVILAGGAQAKNVFWQVGSSATIGDNTSFKGNVLALTSITMNSNAVLTGRILCINGAIVLTSTNIINKP